MAVQLMTKLWMVDNAVISHGPPLARCVMVLRKKKHATVGDLIKVTTGGKMYNAMVVAVAKPQPPRLYAPARFDRNCCVLLNNKFEPLGTRINGPLPSILRKFGARTAKVCALATTFV